MNVFKEKLNSARIQMHVPKNKTKLSVDMSTVYFFFIYVNYLSEIHFVQDYLFIPFI